jgi:multiple sugar transport system permease protein
LKRIVRDQGFVLVAPLILLVLLIVLLPQLWSIILSFTDYRLGAPIVFRGLNTYKTVLKDPQFWNAAERNLIFVVCVVSLEVGGGLLISLLLFRGFRFQKLWVALVLAPYAISPAVAAAIWKYLLDYSMGPVNWVLSSIGVGRLPWLFNPSLALVSVMVVYVWQAMPFSVIILYSALIALPREVYEAASLDGATSFQCFRYVTLPLLSPVLLVVIIFRLIISFRAFGHIWALTRGGPMFKTELLSLYLYRQGFRYWNFAMASAVGTLMLILTLLITSYFIYDSYKRRFAQ